MPLHSTFRLSPEAKADLEYWKRVPAPKTVERIMKLIRDTIANGYRGIGRPEPLKENRYRGCWSKRIDKEHRFIFRIRNNTLEIVSCRTHYGK